MTDEKDAKKPAGAGKSEPNAGPKGGFDLFQNFRHPPKMPEPVSQHRLPVKPKNN